MSRAGDRADGQRLRALIVLLWRAGLRTSEALSLHESDLDRSRGAVLVRPGITWKGRQAPSHSFDAVCEGLATVELRATFPPAQRSGLRRDGFIAMLRDLDGGASTQRRQAFVRQLTG